MLHMTPDGNLDQAISVSDLRRRAKRRLPRAVFDYLDGAAEDEMTLRANRQQFEQWTLLGRFARDVSKRDMSVEIFGRRYAAPFVVSPTGMSGLVRANADLQLARAAGRMNIPFAMSTVATTSIEDLARSAKADLWFQLYILRDRAFTLSLIRRAQDAGFSTLVVTVDCPVPGSRERDSRNGLTLPLRLTVANVLDLLMRPRWLVDQARNGAPRPENLLEAAGRRSNGQALAAYLQEQLDPTVTWSDIAWVRTHWNGALVVKGLVAAEDARLAVDSGADGVLVSNHGGRQLDSAVPTLEALPRVRDAVADRAVVFCDSGFRRGTDIVKALALGARAVFLGRSTLYGVAVGGEAGAYRALEILRSEVDRVMGLIGCSSIPQITQEVLWRRAEVRPPTKTEPSSTAGQGSEAGAIKQSE